MLRGCARCFLGDHGLESRRRAVHDDGACIQSHVARVDAVLQIHADRLTGCGCQTRQTVRDTAEVLEIAERSGDNLTLACARYSRGIVLAARRSPTRRCDAPCLPRLVKPLCRSASRSWRPLGSTSVSQTKRPAPAISTERSNCRALPSKRTTPAATWLLCAWAIATLVQSAAAQRRTRRPARSAGGHRPAGGGADRTRIRPATTSGCCGCGRWRHRRAATNRLIATTATATVRWRIRLVSKDISNGHRKWSDRVTEVLTVIGVGGMGQAIARRLGSGKTVLLADYNEETLASVAESLSADGHHVESRHRRRLVSGIGTQARRVRRLTRRRHAGGAHRRTLSIAGAGRGDPGGRPARNRARTKGIRRCRRAGRCGCGDRQHGRAYVPSAGRRARKSVGSQPAWSITQLDFISSITDPNFAYPIAKQANHIRVRAASAHWGRRGARINSISPGIISTPMGQQELASPVGDGMRAMIAMSANRPPRHSRRHRGGQQPSCSAPTPRSSPAPTCWSTGVSSRP